MAFRYEASTGHVAWEASPRGVGMRVRGVVLMIVAVLACVGLCVPARAVDGVDWRIEDMGVRDAWASGVTGRVVPVAAVGGIVFAVILARRKRKTKIGLSTVASAGPAPITANTRPNAIIGYTELKNSEVRVDPRTHRNR